MGNYDKHFSGSREQRKKISGSREHELKTFLGTRGFINGEQGIKSKKIKGSWEHVPPLGGAHLYALNTSKFFHFFSKCRILLDFSKIFCPKYGKTKRFLRDLEEVFHFKT